MKNTVFTGAATAIITPFTENGVDYEAFGRLIDFQLDSGIDAIVVAGTTGEATTLTDAEHEEVVGFCVKRVAGRIPVIAGTGSNNTAHAIERTKTACALGADAVLLVTPYYNKTTQRGLVESFSAIAGTFAGFQFMMPMIGWLLVTEAARLFKWFSPLIPWIALILLLIIGGGLLKDGMEELRASKSGDTKETESADTVKLTFWALMMQGVATSIDALSVGFTTAAYSSMQALVSSLIIGVVTLFICLAGLRIGRRLGELLAGRASILGGLILIGIGLEIWIKGVFF